MKLKRSEQTAVTGLVRARDRLRLALTYINQKVRTLLIHALSKGQPSRVYVFHKKKSQNHFESHLEQMTVSLFPKYGTLQCSRHLSLFWHPNSLEYRQRESRTNAQLSASVTEYFGSRSGTVWQWYMDINKNNSDGSKYQRWSHSKI